jgi:hypothetical protein
VGSHSSSGLHLPVPGAHVSGSFSASSLHTLPASNFASFNPGSAPKRAPSPLRAPHNAHSILPPSGAMAALTAAVVPSSGHPSRLRHSFGGSHDAPVPRPQISVTASEPLTGSVPAVLYRPSPPQHAQQLLQQQLTAMDSSGGPASSLFPGEQAFTGLAYGLSGVFPQPDPISRTLPEDVSGLFPDPISPNYPGSARPLSPMMASHPRSYDVPPGAPMQPPAPQQLQEPPTPMRTSGNIFPPGGNPTDGWPTVLSPPQAWLDP